MERLFAGSSVRDLPFNSLVLYPLAWLKLLLGLGVSSIARGSRDGGEGFARSLTLGELRHTPQFLGAETVFACVCACVHLGRVQSEVRGTIGLLTKLDCLLYARTATPIENTSFIHFLYLSASYSLHLLGWGLVD